jgi:hypothetical protein
MRTVTAAAITLMLAVTPAVAQSGGEDCVMSAYPTTFGVDGQASLDIASGNSCNLYLSLSGTIESSRIVQSPQHGSLSMSNPSSAVYKAKAGYKGVDEFAFELKGRSMTGAGTSIIRIRANVN